MAFYERILAPDDSNDPLVRADTARRSAIGIHAPARARPRVASAESRSPRRPSGREPTLRTTRRHRVHGAPGRLPIEARASCLHDLKQREQTIESGRQAVELADCVAKATPRRHGTPGATGHVLTTTSETPSGHRGTLPRPWSTTKKPPRSANASILSKLPGVTLRLAESLMNEGLILWGQNSSQAEKRFQEAERLLLSIPPDHRGEGGNCRHHDSDKSM